MVIGILAHVDAGKTTLSENILFQKGVIRKIGRVDYGNSFMDTDGMEKQRGITIFSKEAVFDMGDKKVYLIDTPGHVDFSAEMERTLQVLDYAVMVISAPDGVQSHTETLWRLFEIYDIPVFVFVNKMDQIEPETKQEKIEKILSELENLTDSRTVDFRDVDREEIQESISMADEAMLEYYMETGSIDKDRIPLLIAERKLVPVYFGSALKDEGVDTFLEEFDKYTLERYYGDRMCARVFKIVRDDAGNRLTYVKIMGGSMKVKTPVEFPLGSEKIDQIRIYSGDKYELCTEAQAGTICALTGLSFSAAGQDIVIKNSGEIGNTVYRADTFDEAGKHPVIEAVLRYRMILPEGTDVLGFLRKLRQLEEEEPEICVEWNQYLSEIYVKVLGKIQLEVLKNIILERFGVKVEFDNGNIVYKETIEKEVEGVGHFEPLRHYAEVHLKMEPLETGAGLVIDTDCSEDILDRNWQRLILTHLKEREHPGVLTGSVITDMHITLVTGRAHQKHTEGGDFRQATYRAVRQGLKEAGCVLLEPYYSFRIELPSENIGRAMSDIQRMCGVSETEANDGVMAVLTGECPVSTMAEYQTELTAYTKGRGRLFVTPSEYKKCHNAEEVIENMRYDSESDLDNPTGSVFCANGAGYYVPWNEVKEHMHLELASEKKISSPQSVINGTKKKANSDNGMYGGENELQEIFERTFGTSYHGLRNQEKEKNYNPYKKTTMYEKSRTSKPKEYVYKGKSTAGDNYVLVDGYNIIFAWDELNELSKINLDSARMSLMEILCNYQGYTGCKLILVYDAYKVKGGQGSVEKYKNIYVVYTKEAETADQYIEKTVHHLGNNNRVTVATSDRLEQMIILGEGALRMSANEFRKEVERTADDIRNYCV